MALAKSLDDFPSRVRLRVRIALIEHQTNATAISRQIGWTQSYIAHRLNGRRPFTVEDLAAIAGALGITPDQLILGREWVAA